MSYLDRLKKSANAGGGTLHNHQNLETGGFVGFEGTPPAPFQKIEGAQAANDPTPEPHPARPADTSPAWLLRFVDRDPVAVHYAPAAAHAEVLAAYPDALAVAPLPESALKTTAPSCKTCRHLKRPGLSPGYCGERDDLPPAYGPGHPLRRLPDDQGKSCATWEN
ncbi:hypothetical protein [Zoogloea sp.]|uniref:hypothetical protein n=1 Tax=Zoogloea sp. TaxID=49181 RepID=UPI0035B0C3DE